jgi:L-amino acid N-acyltransferase YncA
MSKNTAGMIAKLSDASAIQAIYVPMVELPTFEEMTWRIESTMPNYPDLVTERYGQLNGFAYAMRHSASGN